MGGGGEIEEVENQITAVAKSCKTQVAWSREEVVSRIAPILSHDNQISLHNFRPSHWFSESWTCLHTVSQFPSLRVGFVLSWTGWVLGFSPSLMFEGLHILMLPHATCSTNLITFHFITSKLRVWYYLHSADKENVAQEGLSTFRRTHSPCFSHCMSLILSQPSVPGKQRQLATLVWMQMPGWHKQELLVPLPPHPQS